MKKLKILFGCLGIVVTALLSTAIINDVVVYEKILTSMPLRMIIGIHLLLGLFTYIALGLIYFFIKYLIGQRNG